MNLIQWRAVHWFLSSERMAWSFLAVRRDDPFSGHYKYYNLHDPGDHAREGDVEYFLPAHDWRVVPAQVWLDRLLSAGTQEAPVKHEPELAVLSQEEFTDAIRKALRHLSKYGELAANPLTRSRLLAGRADPVRALRELLEDSIRDLGRDPRAGKPHRALDVTYLRGAPTQEAAAERLGLSFTTVSPAPDRRHRTHRRRPLAPRALRVVLRRQPNRAKPAAASACSRALGSNGMAVSLSVISSSISVQPRMTASAPCAARSSIIRT